MSKKDRDLTPEEKSSFRQYVKSMPSQRMGTTDDTELAPTSFELSSTDVSHIRPETVIHYHHPSISANTQRKLKRGTLPLEARLDLHGHTIDEATQAVSRWVAHHQQQGHRYGIIIHGKGGKLTASPVLKQLIASLLQAHPGVMAYHSAQPKHGGTGAVYVVLRR